MTLFPIPRSLFEKIKAAAREEVYDAIYRHSGIETSDEELDGWFHSRESELLGVIVIADESTSADENFDKNNILQALSLPPRTNAN